MSIDSQAIHIELLEDVALPRMAGSASGQPSLHYLPGSILLGAVAAKLYRSLQPDQAWTVFHSGAVRFGNGLPRADGEIGYPMPLCWFFKKEASVHEGAAAPWMNAGCIHNGYFLDGADWENMKPLRDHFVSPSGRRLRIEPNARLRTAIDPKTGRAAEAQLFSYESIPAGQQFAATIEFNKTVGSDLRALVMNNLLGTQLLGRSRTAEYGRVHITPGKAADRFGCVPQAGRMMLWLLSDLAAIDARGQPTLQPDGPALGLPAGTFDAQRSYVATRRYAPYNGQRRGRDLDRQVLAAGSVIVLEGIDARTPGVMETLEQGVGLHREQGLGRTAVDPVLLSTLHPAFCEPPLPDTTAPSSAATVAPLTEDAKAWLAWIGQRAAHRDGDDQHEKDAQSRFAEWTRWLERARFQRAGDQAVGPSAAQWGSVRDAAAEATGVELMQRLFEGTRPAIPKGAAGWKDFVDASDPHTTLREKLREALGPKPEARMLLALARLAQRDARDRRTRSTT